MEFLEFVNGIVFGPHNTTTILVLTLVLSYFGFLVPRPTHKRVQDLNDAQAVVISTLLTDLKEGDLETKEVLKELDGDIQEIHQSLQEVSRKVDANGCSLKSSIKGGGSNENT